MTEQHHSFFHNLEKSAIVTLIGIILLFSTAVIVTLIAPTYVDPSWTSPSSAYQVQMYEVSDPNLYISTAVTGGSDLQFVYHLKNDFSLSAFKEEPLTRIVAQGDLEKYITKLNDPQLKLTSRLLLLRIPEGEGLAKANALKQTLRADWEKANPDPKGISRTDYEVLELYAPEATEAFAVAPIDSMVQDWADRNFVLLDEPKADFHHNTGVIYVKNPMEYRYRKVWLHGQEGYRYDANGKSAANLTELRELGLGFRSRKELIQHGEHIYAIEGCWYCHTDQTRTLVQDVVLNGSDSYPAPPSSANEYIYQRITFPGTRRIGPDISRTGIKRPSRDWHKAHFWAPKTASAGSIMPSFQHFFDFDPRGTASATPGIPNEQFEAIFQYLMTKGTRITAPTQAWWLGKDPVKTKQIIEGRNPKLDGTPVAEAKKA